MDTKPVRIAGRHEVIDAEPSARLESVRHRREEGRLVRDVHADMHERGASDRSNSSRVASPTTKEVRSANPVNSDRAVAVSTNDGVRSTPTTSQPTTDAMRRAGPPIPEPMSRTRSSGRRRDRRRVLRWPPHRRDGTLDRGEVVDGEIVRSTDAGEDGSNRILDPPIVFESHGDLFSSDVRIL